MKKLLFVFHIFLAPLALAFPSWMGTYGDFQKHDGGNPGIFTTLMNQDYFGLHAEVGIQINDGPWETYDLAYQDQVDGNSRWSGSVPLSFPQGATVTYYFHGWDDWGGNIWDSAGGANYSFTVPTTTPTPIYSPVIPQQSSGRYLYRSQSYYGTQPPTITEEYVRTSDLSWDKFARNTSSTHEISWIQIYVPSLPVDFQVGHVLVKYEQGSNDAARSTTVIALPSGNSYNPFINQGTANILSNTLFSDENYYNQTYTLRRHSMGFTPEGSGVLQLREQLVETLQERIDAANYNSWTLAFGVSSSTSNGGSFGMSNPQILIFPKGSPFPQLHAGDVRVEEDSVTATVPVEIIGGPLEWETRVYYETLNGSAQENDDFTRTTGTLIIPAGQTTASIDIPIINDTLDERDEYFQINFIFPHGVDVPKSPTNVTIAGNLSPVNYANYVAQLGLQGNAATPESDADGDGINNLMEYAMGSDLTSHSTLSEIQTTAKLRVPSDDYNTVGTGEDSSAMHLALEFMLPEQVPADLTYLVEASSDMQNWTKVAEKRGDTGWTHQSFLYDRRPNVYVPSSIKHEIRVFDLQSVEHQPSRLMRLRVELTE